MKICLMGGSLSDRLDEGMQNITHHLGRELSRRHEVRTVAVRPAALVRCGRSLGAFRPDVIHYTSGPSILSLALLRLAAAASPHSKTVVSALHPWFPLHSDLWIPLFRPDMVLVQSRAMEKFFQRHGCRTAFLSNGVDAARFQPAARGVKSAARAAFGLPADKFIILHVGAVKSGRGVGVCRSLQGGDQQVLVVGSVSTGYEPPLRKDLESRGCIVWKQYIPDIEKVYGAADCYIFPAQDPLHAIETPLSVLEAMAANLPVITTRFGAIADTFAEGDGLIFADSAGEFAQGVRRVREGTLTIRNRDKVLELSWENIAARLEKIYADVAGGGSST